MLMSMLEVMRITWTWNETHFKMKLEVTKTNLILIIVVTLLVGYILIIRNFSKPVIEDKLKYQYMRQVDSLNTVLLEYKNKQLELDTNINNYQLDIKRLDSRIDSASNRLIETRNYYDKKIKSVSRYTTTELDSFFSKRYK
jgi:hypothetical protein